MPTDDTKFPGVFHTAKERALRAIVREEVEAALATAGQSSVHSYEAALNTKVRFGDDWIITEFNINGQWIEVSRLINIFENISMHASFIYDQLRRDNSTPADDVNDQIANVSRRHSAMRKAVTMRDSAFQMACLLRGEDLDLDPEEEITGGSRA